MTDDSPALDEVADILEYWRALCASRSPAAGDNLLCPACERSMFLEATGLRGIAPHPLLHELLRALTISTWSVESVIRRDCDGSPDDEDHRDCAHYLAAQVAIYDRVLLVRHKIAGVLDRAPRREGGWEDRYVIRRLDEWIAAVEDWRPERGMLADETCTTCSESPLRGEAAFRRLPHDLRHSLYALVDELVDEFDGYSPVVIGQVMAARSAIDTVIDWHVDSLRAEWIVDHVPLGIADVQRELLVGAEQPEAEAFLNRRLSSVVRNAVSCVRETSFTARDKHLRSPYALAACPDFQWPLWLIRAVVEVAMEVRNEHVVGRHAKDAKRATFDEWLFRRVRNLTLFEHSVAMQLEAAFGPALRRWLGLRLIRPVHS